VKLNNFLLRDLLSSWSEKTHSDGTNDYWASERLVVATLLLKGELVIRLHVRGFALATVYYVPDLSKLSADLLRSLDIELAKRSVYSYRQVLNAFVSATRVP